MRRQSESLGDLSNIMRGTIELERVAVRILERLSELVPSERSSLQLIQGDPRIQMGSRIRARHLFLIGHYVQSRKIPKSGRS